MNVQKLPRMMATDFILIQHITQEKVGHLYVEIDETKNPIVTAKVIKAPLGAETKVGDTILVNSNAGNTLVYNSQKYLVIREKGNVFAIF